MFARLEHKFCDLEHVFAVREQEISLGEKCFLSGGK